MRAALRPGPVAALAAAAALGWRLALLGRYYGFEEEDFGTLGVVRGVLDGGLRFLELEHMPLYFHLSAAVAALGLDVQTAAVSVSLVAGVAAVALTAWLGARWLSPAAGLVAGLALAFQPEAALLSTTSLRAPLATALVLGTLAALMARRGGPAAVLLSLAFLTRPDPLFTWPPALLVGAALAWRAGDRAELRRVLTLYASLTLTVLLWALYYHSQEHTWWFLGGVVARNTANSPSLGVGLHSLAEVAATTVPRHLGHAAVALAVPGAVAVWRRGGRGRWVVLQLGGAAALYAAIVVRSAYHADHNLYWKWMSALAPGTSLLAAEGARALAAALGQRRRLTALVLAGLAASVALDYGKETARQLDRSARWFAPQIAATLWAESMPEDSGMLCDLIPMYMQGRQPVRLRALSWQDPSLPVDDPAAFGRWLVQHRVGVVMWFAEEWVGARRVAPWLASGAEQRLGPVRLVPRVVERGYGFAAYEVLGDPRIPRPQEPLAPPGADGILRP